MHECVCVYVCRRTIHTYCIAGCSSMQKYRWVCGGRKGVNCESSQTLKWERKRNSLLENKRKHSLSTMQYKDLMHMSLFLQQSSFSVFHNKRLFVFIPRLPRNQKYSQQIRKNPFLWLLGRIATMLLDSTIPCHCVS